MTTLFEVAFWTGALTLFYVYAGFPLCLWAVVRAKPRRTVADLPDEQLPSVSLVVSAYNEEAVVDQKLRNSLALDYPPEKLQMVFVSDASSDGTDEILRRYEGPRVRVGILPERRGKLNALRSAYELCGGDVLVLSDANTYYRADSLRKLVRHFADPEVGVVTGDVRLLPSAQPFGLGEGLYYRYERGLQELESAFWSTVGIDGAMYALRRRNLRAPTNERVVDDFVTGMNVARQGLRIIYEPEAIAEEEPSPSGQHEFTRKVRVIAASIQSLLAREGVPRLTQGRLLWTYVSHKLLRWLVPVILLETLAASVVLAAGSRFWAVVAGLQFTFYLAALAGWRWRRCDGLPFRVPYYFCLVNLAALMGLWRGVRNKQKPVWMRTERVGRIPVPPPGVCS